MRVTTARRAAAAAFFQRVVDFCAQAGKSWSESANSARRQGEKNCECDYWAVEADFVDAGEGLRQAADGQAQCNLCQKQAQRAACNTEREAFEHRLAQQRAGTSSKGETDCNFAAAANGPCQKQSRKICAGDQQDHRRGKKQGADKRPGIFDCVFV